MKSCSYPIGGPVSSRKGPRLLSDLILHSAEWSTQVGYVMVFAPYLRSTT